MRFCNLACIILLLLVTTGCPCGGLTARKVPLSERMAGEDDQDGFRYYTSRPHLVVNEAVPVDLQIRLGLLVQRSGGALHPPAPEFAETVDAMAIEVIMEDGRSAIFDLRGQRRPDLDTAEWRPVQVAETQRSVVQQTQYTSYPSVPYGPADQLADLKALSEMVASQEPVDSTAFQVVHLPDFEEQIAVKHAGFLSQNTFVLRFKDGWQLDSVQDSVDETDVPIRLLQLAQQALMEASTLDRNLLQIQTGKAPVSTLAQDEPGAEQQFHGQAQRVVIVTRSKIEPGMYRLTKQSERHGHVSGCGILADLGIPLVHETSVHLIAESRPANAAACSQPASPPTPMPPVPGDDTPNSSGALRRLTPDSSWLR